MKEKMTSIQYGMLSTQLCEVLRNSLATINFEDFDKAFTLEGYPKAAKERLFMAVMAHLCIKPVAEGDRRKVAPRFILDEKLRSDLARRLTAEKVEYICLNAKVFRSRGRVNNKLVAYEINRIAELKASAKPLEEKKDESVYIYNDETGEFETPQRSDEDQLAILEAQIAQLQKEADAKRAEIEARKAEEREHERLLKLKSDIMEMFDINEKELLEIANAK